MEVPGGSGCFFIETMGHENTRLAGEIGDGRVQRDHRVRSVVGIVEWSDVDIDFGHLPHQQRPGTIHIQIISRGKQPDRILSCGPVLAEKVGRLSSEGISQGSVCFAMCADENL